MTMTANSPVGSLRRHRLTGARADRLYFAQVREDPLLEIDALSAGVDDTVVVVSSGGCTALSLVAAGAGRVFAVDLNTTQNHVVELKAAAVSSLESSDLAGFLGATRMEGSARLGCYDTIRPQLSRMAAAYWDRNSRLVSRGILNAGVSERFIRVVAGALKLGVHSPALIDRLLSCRTLAEQRYLYGTEWDTVRWRLLFRLLMSRRSFDRTYDPRFFEHVENQSFANHFRHIAERALCEVPVSTNYFLHHMLRGEYPVRTAGGVPPYMESSGRESLRNAPQYLELVDGGYAEFLSTLDDGSVDGFALSNICEWLAPAEIDVLFEQIIRVARNGARLCFRNFVGHTEIPVGFRSVVRENVEVGAAAIRHDRSCLQSRIAICRVEN